MSRGRGSLQNLFCVKVGPGKQGKIIDHGTEKTGKVIRNVLPAMPRKNKTVWDNKGWLQVARFRLQVCIYQNKSFKLESEAFLISMASAKAIEKKKEKIFCRILTACQAKSLSRESND